MKNRLTLVLALVAALVLLLPHGVLAQCGGTERWPVKVGSDPSASQVDVGSPKPILIHDLVRLERPAAPGDDTTRLASERTVYVVEGHLLKFKHETGKTGDQDYHLVITDDSLQFSPGGSGTTPVEHSIIAEIVNPDCIAGRHGSPGTTSQFQAQLSDMRTRFNQRFSNISGGWNDAQGVAVRITALAFFDRDHNQVGRALNGLELHPVLDITFLDTAPAPGTTPPPPTPANTLVQSPSFENGPQGWVASDADIISKDSNEPAHSGTGKAWLGGYGTPHSDRLYQEITLPASAHTLTLAFFLHISTDEQQTQAFDKLTVALRRPSGTLIKTLATLSNMNAAPGYQLKAFDLTPYKGQTVRIYFTSSEDQGSLTSFVIDDVRVVVE